MDNSLKEKLLRLNRLHLRKNARKERRAAGRQKAGGDSTAVSHAPSTKFDSTWSAIQEDTTFFLRETGNEPSLEAAVPARIPFPRSTAKGYFHICRNMDKFWKSHQPFISVIGKFNLQMEKKCRELGISTNPEDWCFLDLETCGFSGSSLFLIGCAGFRNNNLILEQFFSRDYDEEPAAIAAFWKHFQSYSDLITFNGKSFDWPFLEERTYVYKQTPFRPRVHLDLLHLFRKEWKNRLPNCKLQTLEHVFCRRSRVGDLAGRQIPLAYHDFVAQPDNWWEMAAAIHHNALDVITMAEILTAFLTDYRSVSAY